MAQKRRKHVGVVLMKPEPARERTDPRTGEVKRSGPIGWRARFTDADTGKVRKVSLDPALTTRDRREDWCVRKSRELAQRRLDLEGGAVRATGTPIVAAVERYYTGHPQLRPGTVSAYRGATDKLVRWASGAGVKTCDDLTRPRLMQFREQLINEPKQGAVTQGRRGQKLATGAERRSAHSVNRELRAVRTVLGYLVDLDLFPKLDADDLRRVCKQLQASVERIVYLKPKQLQKLLESARRHDERHTTIAPFVAFVLLTGMRFGEAIDLEWSEVDLDALDSAGDKVGEIYVTSSSKTKRARTVGLEVSPALRKLLAAQKLRTGGKGSVFGLTRDTAHTAERRLRNQYGAPKGFGWQALRRTCAVFLTNSPGVFGGASAYRSAKQLGHAVQVAERHYLDVARGISPDARDLESAMQIQAQLTAVTASVAKTDRQRRKAG
jgi:integrase